MRCEHGVWTAFSDHHDLLFVNFLPCLAQCYILSYPVNKYYALFDPREGGGEGGSCEITNFLACALFVIKHTDLAPRNGTAKLCRHSYDTYRIGYPLYYDHYTFWLSLSHLWLETIENY